LFLSTRRGLTKYLCELGAEIREEAFDVLFSGENSTGKAFNVYGVLNRRQEDVYVFIIKAPWLLGPSPYRLDPWGVGVGTASSGMSPRSQDCFQSLN
jgi:hypothetical protein